MTTQNEKQQSFPIDLIYMWVDGNDPAWRAKRQKYMPSNANSSSQTTAEARWRNNDELRFSLRSVEMFAPWINHIYVVTDNQRPEWLNTEHPKLTVVDHTEIMPADALPVFNSSAIESCIYKIPGLSEHFLMGNDDTLFTAAVTPDIFFKEDGRPIVRLNRFNRFKWARRGNYTKMLWHMQELVKQACGKMIPYAPHHNFDAYRKSDFEHCVSLYPESWERTAHSRFRQNDDMHRSFVSYYTIATGRAELRRISRYNRIDGFWNHLRAAMSNTFANDSRCIRLNKMDFKAVMRKYNPLMICMNDNERSTEADCQRMVDFLTEMFPDKCSFEK
jgi:hypothetical protein